MTEEKIKLFQQSEARYQELRERLDLKEITPEEMKQQLKALMVLDDEGRYWMIGGKTGRWYLYENNQWLEREPYPPSSETRSPQEGERTLPPMHEASPAPKPAAPAPTPVSHQNELGGESETRRHQTPEPPPASRPVPPPTPTPPAQGVIKPQAHPKPLPGKPRPQASGTLYPSGSELPSGSQAPTGVPFTLSITAIQPLSLALILGGLGLLLGLVGGAILGILPVPQFLNEYLYILPPFMREAMGQVLGGILFGACGGLLGFVLFFVLALVKALMVNLLLFLFGGLRLTVHQSKNRS